jgi:hypothetical protein
LRGDGEQPPIEALEVTPSLLIAELAAIHLQEVACGGQGLADARKVGIGGGVGNREGGQAMQ